MVGLADHCHVPRFILGAEVQGVDSWNRSQKLINIWSSACCDSATEQSPAFAWASWSSRPRRGPGRHPPRTTPWGAFLSPQAHSGFTDRWPLSSRPTPHDRQGPPPMPRAEPVTAQHSTPHPTRSTCYEMLRLPLPAEVWRAWFSTQVTIRHGFTAIHLLTLVARNFRLNHVAQQELRRYDPRSRFLKKIAVSTPLQGVLPRSGQQISVESGRGQPLSAPGNCGWPLSVAPRTENWVCFRARSRLGSSKVTICQQLTPRAIGFVRALFDTPTDELAKSERGPIATSGSTISVWHQTGRLVQKN